MDGQSKLASFETAILPHLDAAYDLARWLTRSDADAEDVVQEAYLRAFRFFSGFHGEDGRAWRGWSGKRNRFMRCFYTCLNKARNATLGSGPRLCLNSATQPATLQNNSAIGSFIGFAPATGNTVDSVRLRAFPCLMILICVFLPVLIFDLSIIFSDNRISHL